MAEIAQYQEPMELQPSSRSARFSEEPLIENNEEKTRKPVSFYLTFAALNICVLLVSLDATALSVAVPVSSSSISRYKLTDS